jgi:parvulin-like peptidyl-prolyl isomerase
MIRYFRKYEKWIFWGIVLLILPTFSVSWVMMDVLSRRDQPPVGQLYGKDVKREDFEAVKRRLVDFLRVIGEEPKNLDELAWEHMAFLEKAERAGIDVSDEELQEQVTELYKQIEARTRASAKVRAQLRGGEQQWQINAMFQRAMREEMPLVEFDLKRYEELVKEHGNTTAGDFEHTLREELKRKRLLTLVQRSAKAPIEKVYERYQEQFHKREARYVAFRADAFAVTGTAGITDDELKKWYARPQTEERYREPKKVAIEFAAAPLKSFDAQVTAPDDAALHAEYDRVKDVRYRLPDAPVAATPTADAPRYRSFDEVKGELNADLRKKGARDLAVKRVDEVRGQVAADLAAGKTVALEDVAKAAGLEYGKTALAEPVTLFDTVPQAHGYFALLRVVDDLAPGAISETGAGDDYALFVRLSERKDERLPPFEEVAAKLREQYASPGDDELRAYFNRNITKYREPEKIALDYVKLDLARFERQVPDTVTGDARAAELRRKANERLDAVRKALGETAEDGKKRDLEAVALEKGVDVGSAVVEKSGTNLPAELEGTDIAAHIASGEGKAGELSASFENAAKTTLFAYRVKETIAAKTPALEDVKDRVRKDVLAERGADRARDAAADFAKEVAPRSPLEPAAGKRGLEVKETPLVGRKDPIPGLDGATQLVQGLFRARDLGDTGGPVYDDKSKTTYVYRWVAREAADPAGFAAKEAEMREQLGPPQEKVLDWELAVKLESRGIGDPALEEVYGLRYGEGGLASIEARQIYIPLDKKTIEEHLDAKAKADAQQVLGEARGGAAFDMLARKWSQDEGTRRRGGDLGFFGRGKMVKEFEDAAFGANPGDVVGPVKSPFGYHLIQVVAKKGEEVRARHILFRAERRKNEDTGELEPLDPETRRLALAVAREKAEKALARLEAGEDFRTVAKDATEEPGAGEKRSYQYLTPFEQAVFSAKPQDLSDVVTDAQGAHLFVNEAWRGGRDEARRQAAKPLLVRQIFARSPNAKKLERIRDELVDFRKRLESGEESSAGRTTWGDFVKRFERYAREESDAPSGAWGGKVGIFDPNSGESGFGEAQSVGAAEIERYGRSFRDALAALEPGKRSGVLEGPEGLSILEVVERTKKTFAEARSAVAETMLQGIEF